MTHFYRELLDRASEQHSATVAATASPTPVAGPSMPTAHNLTIVKPPTLTHSDIELARLARSEGKDVELNDDNQIVDKRDLLSAGLNLSAPNTRRLGIGSSSSKQRREGDAVPVHQAAGAASSRKEIRERQLKLLEQQLAEEEERLARDHEKAVQEELGRVVAKRNGEEELKSARQRYLERKQQSSTQEPASVGPP
jgi:coiled-coil domain-containing protein 55